MEKDDSLQRAKRFAIVLVVVVVLLAVILPLWSYLRSGTLNIESADTNLTITVAKLGDAGMAQVEDVEPAAERSDQTRPDGFDLPGEQQVPNGVVLDAEVRPILGHDVPRPSGGFVFEGKCDVRNHGDGPFGQ